MHYWTIKTEPSSYSIDDLKRDKKTFWSGVRNYQARNFLRDDMAVGDLCLFYHSGANPPAAAGICKVVKAGYPDPTQFDHRDSHYDMESTPHNPRWYMVDVAFVEKFRHPVSLEDMKKNPKLRGMKLIARGNRLSVFPLGEGHFEEVVRMAL